MPLLGKLRKPVPLKTQLSIWIICVVVALLLFNIIGFFFLEWRLTKINIEGELQMSADAKAIPINKWMEERQSDIRMLSEMAVFRQGDLERMEPLLKAVSTRNADFATIHFIDKTGRIAASTESKEAVAGFTAVDREYYRDALLGKPHVTELLIGKASGEPALFLSYPVWNDKRDVIGLVLGSVRLKTIDKLLDISGPYQTLDNYLVDRNGMLLSESRFKRGLIQRGNVNNMESKMMKVETDIIQYAFDGIPLHRSYLDFDGKPAYGAYRWVNQDRWLLVVKLDRREVLQGFFNHLIYQSAVTAGLLLLLVIFARVLLHSFAYPMYKLKQGAERIRKGNYRVSIQLNNVSSVPAELHLLCDAFNEMAATIQRNMDEIDSSHQETIRILESITDAFMALDKEWKFTYVNKEAERILGRVRDELIGTNIWETFPLIKGTAFYHAYLKATAEQKPVAARDYFEPMGRWFELRAYPFGEGLSVFVKDVTDQVIADEWVRRSEEKYRFVAEHSADMITVHHIDGTYEFVSAACVRLMGFEPEELVGTSPYLYFHPDEMEMLQQSHREVTESDEIQVPTYRLRKKDGDYVWVETKSKRVIGLGDEPKLICVTRDVTERKKAEQTLLLLNEKLQEMSMLDGLTQIANRRKFDLALSEELRRGARNSQPLSLILIDIDYFKLFNDTYGHLSGDQCLKSLAAMMTDVIHRPGDVAARYGGEEFAVILPNTDAAGAMEVAELIRKLMESAAIPHSASKVSDVVTISLGVVSVIPSPETELDELVSMADKALYMAKRTRNAAMLFQAEG